MGLTSELKARLGAERYALLQSVSVNFQRSALDAREYYDVALDILEGDAASLLALVDRLPDRRKRESVHAAHRAAASPSVAPAAPAAPAAEPRRVDGQMPAPADAIPATPPAAAHEDDHLCPVCIDAVPRARCEPCGHALCAACLDLWRRTVAGDDRRAAPTCPMCRAEVRGFAVVEGPEDPERLDWAGAESNGAECRAGAASNAASNATLDATLDAASDASSRGDGAKKLSRGARGPPHARRRQIQNLPETETETENSTTDLETTVRTATRGTAPATSTFAVASIRVAPFPFPFPFPTRRATRRPSSSGFDRTSARRIIRRCTRRRPPARRWCPCSCGRPRRMARGPWAARRACGSTTRWRVSPIVSANDTAST